jgi:hypothetical protein
MMEKLAQAGECGGARSPLFTISTITYKFVVYAAAEKADTLPLFPLYPYMYSMGNPENLQETIIIFSIVKKIKAG